MEKPKLDFKAIVLIIWRNLVLLFNINVSLIFNILRGIVNIFIPKTPKNIEGQVVLITGGANGIGKCLAIEFAKEKCKIAIVDINDESGNKVVKELRENYNVKAKFFKADVSNYEKMEDLREAIENEFGTVDILVNNAGILTTDLSLFEKSHEEIQKIINVNLSSHFWFLRTFMRGMVEKKRGHIVAMNSMYGKITHPCSTTYAATKHGITGLMNALEVDLKFMKLDFIKTTSVYPFYINSNEKISDLMYDYGFTSPLPEPDALAKVVVHGVRRNKTSIYFPSLVKLALLEKIVPKETSYLLRIFPAYRKSDVEKIRNIRTESTMKGLNLPNLNKNLSDIHVTDSKLYQLSNKSEK